MIPEVASELIDVIRRAADPAAITRSFCRGVFPDADRVRVLSVGKAGASMMLAGFGVLGDRVSAGLIVAPEEQCVFQGLDRRIGVMPSDHPLPTERSVAAADAVLRFVSEGDEPLVVLLSGGGSAMVVKPVDGTSLDDMRTVADGLMRAGATIDELNCVRKHLDLAKGGCVGVATRGRPVAVGVISDVLGDRLDVISSGPFVGDVSTFADARRVLDRTRVRVPAIDAVIDRGVACDVEETPKPGDDRLSAITHEVLASNASVACAAAETIEQIDADVQLFTDQSGEAQEWGARLADRLKAGPGAIVLGGESVVSDVPTGSVGGPVQEAVLAAGRALRGVSDWLVLGYATDGVDGPTDAAGAVLTPDTLPGVRKCDAGLAIHDSHPVLDAANALIRTGPTGTNVNDVLIGIRCAD